MSDSDTSLSLPAAYEVERLASTRYNNAVHPRHPAMNVIDSHHNQRRQVDIVGSAVSRNGSIAVETTEEGLPIRLTVEHYEICRPPAELAREILRLCQQSANRVKLARRAELEAAGLSREALEFTGLPTRAEIAQQELVEESLYDHEPRSWLKPS